MTESCCDDDDDEEYEGEEVTDGEADNSGLCERVSLQDPVPEDDGVCDADSDSCSDGVPRDEVGVAVFVELGFSLPVSDTDRFDGTRVADPRDMVVLTVLLLGAE